MKNTFAYDFKTGEFKTDAIGEPIVLTGINALQLWIDKTIHTQSNRYKIYNGEEYGANIEDLVIGNTYGIGFVESELKREIETALLRHEDITELSDFSVSKIGSTLKVSFTLTTTYGAIEEVYAYDS